MGKHKSHRKPLLFLSLLLCGNSLVDASAAEDDRAKAKKIFTRLTGSSIKDSDSRLTDMEAAIVAGDPLVAARIASEDRRFFNTTLRNWSGPWSNPFGSANVPLDDLQATAIGVVRDRLDIRLLITGDFYYAGKSELQIPFNPNSNTHYYTLETTNKSLGEVLEKFKFAKPLGAGIFQSRSFAKSFYEGGTNRRAVKFAFKNFLCQDLPAWREPSLPDYYVRRDVDRRPSGNLMTYHAECRGCHAPMDAMSGAFAYVDFQNEGLLISTKVLDKYNQHAEVYPDGFVTIDSSWVNLLGQNQQSTFGWRGSLEGATLSEFSAMLGNSRAFSECMVRQAAVIVCRKSLDDPTGRALIKRLSLVLEQGAYDMRNIFEKLSVDDDC